MHKQQCLQTSTSLWYQVQEGVSACVSSLAQPRTRITKPLQWSQRFVTYHPQTRTFS